MTQLLLHVRVWVAHSPVLGLVGFLVPGRQPWPGQRGNRCQPELAGGIRTEGGVWSAALARAHSTFVRGRRDKGNVLTWGVAWPVAPMRGKQITPTAGHMLIYIQALDVHSSNHSASSQVDSLQQLHICDMPGL